MYCNFHTFSPILQLKWADSANTETVVHSDKDFASVAFLRIKQARLEPKTATTAGDIAVPPLLTDEYDVVCKAVSQSQQSDRTSKSSHAGQIFPYPKIPLCSSRQKGAWVAISNVCSRPGATSTLEEEVTLCFQLLIGMSDILIVESLFIFTKDRLAEHRLQLSNCAFINVYISSIDMFLRVNAIYATFFGVSPPARACISVDLPEGTRVCLDCTAFAEYDHGTRQALHVQGLSYWAPANIGPYSQAIIVRLIFLVFYCAPFSYRLVNASLSLARSASYLANCLCPFLALWLRRWRYHVNMSPVLHRH